MRALELLGRMADVALFETRTVVEHRKPDYVRAALVSKLRRFVLTEGTMEVQEATPTTPGEDQTGRASRATSKPIPGGHQVAATDLDSGQPIGTVTFKKKDAALAYALKFFFDHIVTGKQIGRASCRERVYVLV